MSFAFLRKDWLYFLLGALVFAVIPAVLFFVTGLVGNSLWIVLLYELSLFLLLVTAAVIVSYACFSFLRGALCVILAGYSVLLYLTIAYELTEKTAFDLRFLLDSADSAITTLINVLGEGTFFSIVAATLIIWVVFSFVWLKTLRFIRYRNSLLIQIALLAVSILAFLDVRFLLPVGATAALDVAHGVASRDPRESVKPYFPDRTGYTTKSSDNVFIVQLESGNGMAAQGMLTIKGKKYDGNYIPHISEISKNGVFFPLFWGGATQTNRAQEIMLCGLNNNVQKGFSGHPEDIESPCLPELLKRSGYTTIVFRSDTLVFAHEGTFFQGIGFSEVHYKDIMDPSEKKYHWGYDDCAFYKSAFEYLKKTYPDPKKLLVYFEVSSHHVPFGPKPGYEDTRPFPEPSTFIEKYLNSYAMQDQCVQTFYDAYSEYSAENSHLFVLPDHGWPVGLHGSTYNEKGSSNDNFLIHLSYLPPLKDAEKYRVGEKVNQRYSEEFLVPTIFDLLNKKPYGDSFAFALRKNEEKPKTFDDCVLELQPYEGGNLVIIKNQKDLYHYSLARSEVTYYDLSKDLFQENPKVIETGMSYNEFRKSYYCKRYL